MEAPGLIHSLDEGLSIAQKMFLSPGDGELNSEGKNIISYYDGSILRPMKIN
jgi:hypothetical protein